MRHTSFVAAAGLMLGIAFTAQAQVPGLLNFQGKLLDLSNNPRNGSYNLTFRVFSVPTGGAALWSETQSGVSVSNGVFSVQLGAVTPIPASVFAASPTYLEVQVGAEVGSPRQQLVTSPYAFTAQNANNLLPGNANYVQVASSLQSGATFYVSSGTVAGPLTVGGVLTTGSGAVAVTTPSGFIDATKLSGTIPSAQVSGSYSNALALSNAANAISGNGSGLTAVTAAHLLPGDTNYLQNRDTLQPGATFYAAKGTVGGPFTATGTVTLGGAAGVNDVTVNSNLSVAGNLSANGAGPHVFNGNVQVNGNNLLDSAGTSRVTLGATNLINGGVGVPSGNGLFLSTSVFFNGAVAGDNYIAFPFTASTVVNVGDAVIISGANTVGTVAANANTFAIGFAVTPAALAGQTVWVATSGIITTAVAGGAITTGSRVCTSSNAAGRVAACTTNGAPIGKALTGTTAAAQTLTVVIWNGN